MEWLGILQAVVLACSVVGIGLLVAVYQWLNAVLIVPLRNQMLMLLIASQFNSWLAGIVIGTIFGVWLTK